MVSCLSSDSQTLRSIARFCGAWSLRTPALVLVKSDIQHPMALVLDGPILADHLLEARCVRCEAGEVLALLHALLPTANLLAVRLDADNRVLTRPILALQFGAPLQAIGGQHHQPLDPSVASVAAESSALLLSVAKVSNSSARL